MHHSGKLAAVLVISFIYAASVEASESSDRLSLGRSIAVVHLVVPTEDRSGLRQINQPELGRTSNRASGHFAGKVAGRVAWLVRPVTEG